MNIRWYSIIQKSTFSLEPHCSIQMFRSEQICMSWNFTFIIVSLWTRLSSETQSMHKSICLWPLHVGVISHSFQTIDGILSKTLLVFGLEDSRQLVFVCICWHPEEVRKLNVHFSFLSKSFQRRYVISSLPRSERPTHVLRVKLLIWSFSTTYAIIPIYNLQVTSSWYCELSKSFRFTMSMFLCMAEPSEDSGRQ